MRRCTRVPLRLKLDGLEQQLRRLASDRVIAALSQLPPELIARVLSFMTPEVRLCTAMERPSIRAAARSPTAWPRELGGRAVWAALRFMLAANIRPPELSLDLRGHYRLGDSELATLAAFGDCSIQCRGAYIHEPHDGWIMPNVTHTEAHVFVRDEAFLLRKEFEASFRKTSVFVMVDMDEDVVEDDADDVLDQTIVHYFEILKHLRCACICTVSAVCGPPTPRSAA